MPHRPLAHQLGEGEGLPSAWSGSRGGVGWGGVGWGGVGWGETSTSSFSTVPNPCLLQRGSKHEWAASAMTFQVPRAA